MKLKKFLLRAVAPVSKDEDVRRREFILHVLLLASITLLTIAIVSSVFASFFESALQRSNDAMSLMVLSCILLGFFGLYALSITGRSRIAAAILLLIFFLLSLHLAHTWGPDLPTAVLFYALTIVMTGILLSSRLAFLVTVVYVIVVPLINHLQRIRILPLNAYWRTEPLLLVDTLVMSFMLAIIATVSWLSNRETERSLVRARQSEGALREERDLLERRVLERTEALRAAEMEKLSQTYRFVEFGRLAGSVFHDLANPLAALSLNIESIAKSHGTTDPRRVAFLSEDVARARSATNHMQMLLASMRKHLAREGMKEYFSLSRTIAETVHTLSPYARSRNITLSLMCAEELQTFGDPVAFVQVLTNLISNAIESFPPDEGTQAGTQRAVVVALTRKFDHVHITVEDTGTGIPKESLEAIFQPFFSTKPSSEGLGIGLPLAKRIVEREFGGSLTVVSTLGEGTIFTVYFEIREP